MKKLILAVIVLLVISSLLPAKSENPQSLKTRVEALETEVKDLKNTVENLESIVNYVLSSDFKEQVCKSCEE